MCGIVGVIVKGNSGFFKQPEDCFTELLYVNALRGFDSTGVIGVEKDGGFHIMKEAEEAAWFLPQFKGSVVQKAMWEKGKAYIGHNRKKTVGDIKDETAHPFVIDDTFAMVHNGTLYNHKNLANTDIDSQALATVLKNALGQDNWKKALEDTLGDVFGAYAVAIYDQKKELIHFLRNKERPLWLIETDNALYFASEASMATWILCRNGYAAKDLKVTAVDEHTLITYDLSKNTLSKEALTPKKYMPVIHTPSTTGTGKTNGGTDTKITKSMAKFFKKKWIGKRVSFWVDDYVEKYYPKTVDEDNETEVFLFARLEEIAFTHALSIEVDLKNCGLSTSEEIFEQKWTGYVDEVIYNEEAESILINIQGCKPIVNSLRPTPYVNRTVFENVLKEKSLVLLEQEFTSFVKNLVPWQRECYEKAILERKKEVDTLANRLGYDACFDEAEKEGVKLIEKTNPDTGKRELHHPTKGLIYETPITLH